ncbi:MAG: hypothetical protein WDA27_11090 [Actinomycetota bacterium]
MEATRTRTQTGRRVRARAYGVLVVLLATFAGGLPQPQPSFAAQMNLTRLNSNVATQYPSTGARVNTSVARTQSMQLSPPSFAAGPRILVLGTGVQASVFPPELLSRITGATSDPVGNA